MMITENKPNLEIVSDDMTEPVEDPVSRSTYESEKRMNACIKNGDVQSLREYIRNAFFDKDSPAVIGRMSKDSVRQAQYTAVACIAIAVRVAMDAGYPEQSAYTRSDIFIRNIDKMKNSSDIFDELFNELMSLTADIHKMRLSRTDNIYIRKAQEYIDIHIFEPVSLSDLALECGISESYLSRLFKEKTDMTTSQYIMKQKIEKACDLLLSTDYDYCDISTHLGFCSQSYFIKCFRNITGMTPAQYKRRK